MPISRHYDENLGILFVTVSGEVSEEEFLAHAREQANDDSIPTGTWELHDFRELKSTFSRETLAHIATIFLDTDQDPESSRVAVVVSGDLGFGSGRQYQTFRNLDSPVELRIFKDMSEARAWLEMPG